MTFYLKHRPQKISELDLADVRETLNNIVESENIPHAFLFAGPRGTGKTSAARILAKVVNCTRKGGNPKTTCNKCEQCETVIKGSNIDVVELDAASHRGIDDVRALREAVKLAPAKARKKVYIIDEAHMLTTEAANALLKTLEEPPGHVLFILATTNPEKLPETIRSRTTLLNFQKAIDTEVARSLKRVIKREKIKIDEASIAAIAKASDGSFRDATKTLEQLLSESKNLKSELVEDYLFQNKTLRVENLLSLLKKKEAKKALEEVERVVAKGASIKNYLQSLIEALRKSLLAKIGIGKDELPEYSKSDIVTLINHFSKAVTDLPTAVIDQLPLELAIVRWCQDKQASGQNGDVLEKETGSSEPSDLSKKNTIKKSPQSYKEKSNVKVRRNDDNNPEISQNAWKEILTMIRPRNASTEALLRATKPVNYDGQTLTLAVFYKFHKDRLEEIQHRNLLEEVIANVTGGPVRVICTLAPPPAKEKIIEVIDDKKAVAKAVSNVVGDDALKKPDSAAAASGGILTESGDEDIIRVAKEIFGN